MIKQQEQAKKSYSFKLNIIRNYKEIILWSVAFIYLIILVAIATKGFNPNKAPYKPEFLKLGSKLTIRWYAVFILSGIIVAALMGKIEFKKINMKKDSLSTLLLIVVPIAIICARLYYVAFDPDKSNYTSFKSVIGIGSGGLAIHGAFIGAVIMTFALSKKFKYNAFQMLDIVVIGFLVGQIFGRWGNFMNQEAHGGVVGGSPLSKIMAPFVKAQMTFADIDVAITGRVLWHPTFLYELFFNFLLLMALLVYRRMRILKVGDMFCLYLIYYAVLRGMVIEPFRTDPLKINGVNINQYPQLGLYLFISTFIYILRRVIAKKKDKRIPYYFDITSEVSEDNINSRKIKAVLFDFDGTLLKSEDIIMEAFQKTFKKVLNIEVDNDKVKTFIGPTLMETVLNYTKDQNKIEEFVNTYKEISLSLHTKKRLKLYPGVKFLLSQLKSEGYKLGVVSSKKEKVILKGLETVNLKNDFDIIVSHDDVKNHKPHSDCLTLALRELKLKKQNACYVGDHKNDILAAQNLKMLSFVVSSSVNLKEALDEKPDKVLLSIKDLYKELKYQNEV